MQIELGEIINTIDDVVMRVQYGIIENTRKISFKFKIDDAVYTMGLVYLDKLGRWMELQPTHADKKCTWGCRRAKNTVCDVLFANYRTFLDCLIRSQRMLLLLHHSEEYALLFEHNYID